MITSLFLYIYILNGIVSLLVRFQDNAFVHIHKNLPSQMVVLPAVNFHPGAQSHVKEPGVLVQIPLSASQLSVSDSHSSSSDHMIILLFLF